jgi:hypothetical protein
VHDDERPRPDRSRQCLNREFTADAPNHVHAIENSDLDAATRLIYEHMEMAVRRRNGHAVPGQRPALPIPAEPSQVSGASTIN